MKIEELGVMDLAPESRAVLGDEVPLFFYRYVNLFALAESLGSGARDAMVEAGRKMGQQFARDMHYRTLTQWAQHYKQHGMGILSIESEDPQCVRLRVEECAICSGLPRVDMALCWVDAGILSAAVQTCFAPETLDAWWVDEVECTGLGHSACVFEVRPPGWMEGVGKSDTP